MPAETLTIETPEHVELHFALASVGNRFLACAIDHSIQLLAIVAVALFASLAGGWLRGVSGRISASMAEGSLWVFALATLAVFVLFFGYFTIFETLWNGQTPGKRWLRLRVIQEDGRPITFFAALSRNLIRGADMMPTLILPFYSIGIISVFASGKSQRIGDLIAGTVVIKERSAEAPSFEEVFESEIIDSAMRRLALPVEFTADVLRISRIELEVVEAFLRRRTEIPDHPRQWLAWRIATPLIEKLRLHFDPEDPNYEGFLEEVLARHNSSARYRSQAD
jgi:uncharacterized RDD family membrane protein YckC